MDAEPVVDTRLRIAYIVYLARSGDHSSEFDSRTRLGGGWAGLCSGGCCCPCPCSVVQPVLNTQHGAHAGGALPCCCATGTAPRVSSFASYSLGGWLVFGMLGAARRCRFQTQRRVRQCSGGSGLVLGMLNVFHLPTTSAGGGSVSLLLFFYNRSHICCTSLAITQRGRLGGLTCAILKLERSCLHHIRGLGARGRHAPLVGVHIILKDDSGGIDLVVVVLNVMIFNIPAHSGVARCGCRIASSRSTTSSNFRARGYLCMFFVVCCLPRCPSTPPDLVLQQKIHSGHCSCLLLLLLCVVCCGESRSQRHLFSNTRGSHSACVVALSYVRTHDQNTNSPESLGGGCSARTALARSTASCKSPGILVFCVLCSSLRVFVLVP